MEEVKRESDGSVGTIFSGVLIHVWCSSESRSTTVCVLMTVKEKQCVSVMFTEQLSSHSLLASFWEEGQKFPSHQNLTDQKK